MNVTIRNVKKALHECNNKKYKKGKHPMNVITRKEKTAPCQSKNREL